MSQENEDVKELLLSNEDLKNLLIKTPEDKNEEIIEERIPLAAFFIKGNINYYKDFNKTILYKLFGTVVRTFVSIAIAIFLNILTFMFFSDNIFKPSELNINLNNIINILIVVSFIGMHFYSKKIKLNIVKLIFREMNETSVFCNNKNNRFKVIQYFNLNMKQFDDKNNQFKKDLSLLKVYDKENNVILFTALMLKIYGAELLNFYFSLKNEINFDYSNNEGGIYKEFDKQISLSLKELEKQKEEDSF